MLKTDDDLLTGMQWLSNELVLSMQCSQLFVCRMLSINSMQHIDADSQVSLFFDH